MVGGSGMEHATQLASLVSVPDCDLQPVDDSAPKDQGGISGCPCPCTLLVRCGHTAAQRVARAIACDGAYVQFVLRVHGGRVFAAVRVRACVCVCWHGWAR